MIAPTYEVGHLSWLLQWLPHFSPLQTRSGLCWRGLGHNSRLQRTKSHTELPVYPPGSWRIQGELNSQRSFCCVTACRGLLGKLPAVGCPVSQELEGRGTAFPIGTTRTWKQDPFLLKCLRCALY